VVVASQEMLGSQGIQPVTLVFNNSRNCFLQLSSNFATHLCLQENQILELSWGVSAPVFLSWTRSRSSGPEDRSTQKIKILSSSHELHSMALEQRLLDQIRVVFSEGVFPVWVDQHTVIYIRIASLSPSVPFGRLEQFTELVVSPKLHPGGEQQLQTRSEEPSQHLQYQNIDVTSSSSLVRYLFTRGFEPAKENLAVPTIPNILKDCILRTCGTPPGSVSHLGSCHGDVHILPWNLQENWNPGQSALTYGRLSKILSPKELREKVKLAMEKKKIRDGPHKGNDTEEHKENTVVVRMLCHNMKRLQEDQKFNKCEEIYSGRVWIPKVLQRRLRIEPRSAVRIQPLKSKPRVAEAVMVQPAVNEKEEDIQTAFLNWLHALSHQPLSCLTGRKEEFVLTVLKPEQQQEDEMFFLSTSLLKKTNLQPDDSDHSGSDNDSEDPHLGFPSLSSLGGVEDICRSAFEHISHALMGGPLSRELVSTGRGLRGGALLITGAKGSGKSSLSRALCRKASEELDAHVQVVDCKTLKGLRDLVDEMVVRSSLIALMITAQSEHALHQTLTAVQGSHFFQSFCKIQTPDQTQRVEILRSLIAKKNFQDCETTLDLDSVARETEGFMPQDLNLLLERAIHANTLHSGNNGGSEDLNYNDFRQALQGFTPPSLWGAQLQAPTGADMERIGGLHQARQLLMDIILLPAKYPLLFSSLPMRQCSGVLLYGAPGTGKTLLAGAVAKESGMNFISIKGPELLSKYIGASEQAVRDVFQRAQQAKPCILFFDEFDSLAPRRGHDNTGVTDRVVNQLLTQLDGVEGLTGVYVLAATSRPDLIDPALLRPGRLDKSLYCPPPDRVSMARLEILKALTHCVPLAADVDLEQIAVATELFTGADLKALLYNAQLEAIHSSLGPNLLHDLCSGSDSDVSLSSLIFLNHSSGSDDSAGEGDAGLEHSMVLLDPSELPPEDPRHNIWRLYFGSSFESELDNQSLSELNSQCLSGPNSTAPDMTGASMRDPNSCHVPVFMSCLQDGFQELTHEQSERLRAEVNTVKNSYRRNTDESSLVQTGPSKPGSLICQSHLISALANTRASVSREDWRRYTELYESFGASKQAKSQSTASFKAGQRVTLA
uniref:Peroxisomal ATPase PEX1 n=1 Tax=Cyprinus carpio TaxID=7962 RepID=A0A8C1TPJ7_CYPCA